MDLLNNTIYPSTIKYAAVEEGVMIASVINKVIVEIDDQGNIIELAEGQQKWDLEHPVVTPFGEFDAEIETRKGGTDIIIMGYAYPSNHNYSVGQVKINFGSEIDFTLAIFGERRWQKSGDSIIASPPKSFQRLAMSWENAYGGKISSEFGEIPHGANANGKGYYTSQEAAINSELPNIEDPENLISNWFDQPDPVGTAPLSKMSTIRALNSIDLSSDKQSIEKINPYYFNNAHPKLIAKQQLGEHTLCVIQGMSANAKPLRFRIPDYKFHVHVQLSDRQYTFPSMLDSVIVSTESKKLALGYRCCFRYKYNPMERRLATLYQGELPNNLPIAYTVDWPTYDRKYNSL